MENSSGTTTGATGTPSGSSMGSGAASATGQVTQAAGQVMDQARDQIKTQLHDQKDRAAGSLGTVAQALRQTGQQLRQQNETTVGQYAERAADWVEQLSGQIRQKNVDEVLEDVSDFARRQPGIFIGGAFALGFLAARFLKSSSTAGAGNGYSRSGDYSRSDSYGQSSGYRQRDSYGPGSSYGPSGSYGQSSSEKPSYGPGQKDASRSWDSSSDDNTTRPLHTAYEHAMEDTAPTSGTGASASSSSSVSASSEQATVGKPFLSGRQVTEGSYSPSTTGSSEVPVLDDSEDGEVPVSHGSTSEGTGSYGI